MSEERIIKVLFAADGITPQGYYPSDIFNGEHADKIPANAVEIPEGVWLALVAAPGSTYVNGEVRAPPPSAPQKAPPNPFDEILRRLDALEKRK